MKKLIGILILGLLFSDPSLANNLKVVDGDTIVLNGEKIRFSGIDTPELKQTCLKDNEKVGCGMFAKKLLVKKIGSSTPICIGKKKDFYKMIGNKYLNKKTFPYGKKINFNSIRKGKTVGEHEVKFSSGKEILTLNHEAFDRALYSEGALTAAKWLMSKKPGLYSMRNILNFK